MYCRKYLTNFYEKVYEIWRQLNSDCRMYMDANKLITQKNSYHGDKKELFKKHHCLWARSVL